MPMDQLHQGMTSYYCSIVTLGVGGIVLRYKPLNSADRNTQQHAEQEQEQRRKVSNEPLMLRDVANKNNK